MKLPKPTGVVKLHKRIPYPNSFIISYKGDSMDSPKAEKQLRSGNYLLIHPITLEESIGKVVVLSLPTSLTVWEVVRFNETHVTVRFFNPCIIDTEIPLNKVEAIYLVDEVLEEITVIGTVQHPDKTLQYH